MALAWPGEGLPSAPTIDARRAPRHDFKANTIMVALSGFFPSFRWNWCSLALHVLRRSSSGMRYHERSDLLECNMFRRVYKMRSQMEQLGLEAWRATERLRASCSGDGPASPLARVVEFEYGVELPINGA